MKTTIIKNIFTVPGLILVILIALLIGVRGYRHEMQTYSPTLTQQDIDRACHVAELELSNHYAK